MCLVPLWRSSAFNIMKGVVSILFLLLIGGGCSGSKSLPAAQIGTNGETPAYVIRVQSSYGDLQQIQVLVKEWLVNGTDQRPFDQQMTPFEIPVYQENYKVHLATPGGGAELNIQVIREGERLEYVQSKEVCVEGSTDGMFELQNCMDGLR